MAKRLKDMRNLIKKCLLTLVALTIFSGCMVRTVRPPVELEAYYVENPLEGDYRPSRMLMSDDNVGVIAAWSVSEQATAFFVTSDGGLN